MGHSERRGEDSSDAHAAIAHMIRQIGCTHMNYLPLYIHCQ